MCFAACGNRGDKNKTAGMVLPQITLGGVLYLPWGCTVEEFTSSCENAKIVYSGEFGDTVTVTRSVDGYEVNCTCYFEPYDAMIGAGEPILSHANFSPRSADKIETVRNAITADLGEKLVGGVTMNGNYYGELSRWTSGKTVLELMNRDEVEKAVEDGAPEMSLYSCCPLTVTDGKDYFEADANWGIMLRHWIED